MQQAPVAVKHTVVTGESIHGDPFVTANFSDDPQSTPIVSLQKMIMANSVPPRSGTPIGGIMDSAANRRARCCDLGSVPLHPVVFVGPFVGSSLRCPHMLRSAEYAGSRASGGSDDELERRVKMCRVS